MADPRSSSHAPVIPLIDPTANVIKLVDAAIARQDDLRAAEAQRVSDLNDQADKFNTKLEEQRRFFETEAKKAEAGRIDSLLAADKANVALALAKQEAQAIAQDKRIAALEQNQYQGVGAGAQRTEGRANYQWAIGIALLIAGLLVGLLGHAPIFGK
jgi:hypothetical protein